MAFLNLNNEADQDEDLMLRINHFNWVVKYFADGKHKDMLVDIEQNLKKRILTKQQIISGTYNFDNQEKINEQKNQ